MYFDKSLIKAILCCILFVVCIFRVTKFSNRTRSIEEQPITSIREISDNNLKIEKKESTESIFRKRKKYMERGCTQLRKIQNLVDKKDYNALLKLHEDIHNLDLKLKSDRENCTAPSYNDPRVSNAKIRILICLISVKLY